MYSGARKKCAPRERLSHQTSKGLAPRGGAFLSSATVSLIILSQSLAIRCVLFIGNFRGSIRLLAHSARFCSSSNKLNSGISLDLALLVALSLDFRDLSRGAQTLIISWS